MAEQKQWWTPVWKGLIMDPGARHYRRMKSAVWLFLYLMLNADRKTGLLLRKVKTISFDMGVKKDTIMRWMDILRKGGYIATLSTGRCLSIRVNKWRPPEVGKNQYQISEISNTRGWKNPSPQKHLNGQNYSNPSENFSGSPPPNDITIKKGLLKNDININNFSISNLNRFKNSVPRNEKELLAMDLASALDDLKNFPLYLSCANKYPANLLRQILGEVKEVPLKKIKKSRGALFNYLVQKYVQKTNNNSGD